MTFLKLGQDRNTRVIYRDFLNKSIQELADAKKDNDFIYHERIPDTKHLEPISKAVLAKPTELPPKFFAKFKGKIKIESIYLFCFINVIFF